MDAPTAANLIAVVSAVAAIASAIYARRAIDMSIRDQRARATFDYLRELDKRQLLLFRMKLKEVRDRVIEEYNAGTGMSDDCIAFLDFMNTLNVVAYAVDRDIVDGAVIREFIKNMAQASNFLFGFIKEFRGCCNDHLVYRYAFKMLLDLRLLLHEGTQ